MDAPAREKTRHVDHPIHPGRATIEELEAFSKFVNQKSPAELVLWLKQGYADYESDNIGYSQPPEGEPHTVRNGFNTSRPDNQGWMFWPLYVNNVNLSDRSPITILYDLFPDVYHGADTQVRARLEAAFLAVAADKTDPRRAKWAGQMRECMLEYLQFARPPAAKPMRNEGLR